MSDERGELDVKLFLRFSQGKCNLGAAEK